MRTGRLRKKLATMEDKAAVQDISYEKALVPYTGGGAGFKYHAWGREGDLEISMTVRIASKQQTQKGNLIRALK